jgi:Mycothiol maleylpyruvate isomerase N-terminal domain
MGERAEGLAKRFEAKAGEMSGVIEKLSDADWKKVTSAEKWSVAVTAHHVAGSHEPIASIVKTVASGQTVPPFTMAQLDESNAKHAKDFAGCTKAETLALHKKGAADAARMVRGLSDAQLDQSGTVLIGMSPMSAQQIIEGVLINHVQEHMDSIRNTVGH